MSGPSNTTPPRAVEGFLESTKLHRRKRAATVDYYAEPEQPQWILDDETWADIEDECDLEEGALDNVRGAIEEAALDYFYLRDFELSAFNLADAQAFLAQVLDAATGLDVLLNGEPDKPAIAATQDVLRDQLIDMASPALKAHIERSPEPAHEAVLSFDAFQDVSRELGRLIKETAGVIASNAERAAKRKPEPPAWNEMVGKITQALEGVGIDTAVGGYRVTSFVSLMVALTRRFPEKYHQHHLGHGGESPGAMSKAISEARKSR